MKNYLLAIALFSVLLSCKKKEDPAPEPEPTPTTTGGAPNNCPTCDLPDTVWTNNASGPKLIFKFKFDSTQVRLSNTAQTVAVAAGNAGQSPRFNHMSAHYIELAPTDLTAVGGGKVLYHAEETTCGGAKAIVFCKSTVVKENEVFFSIPIASVTPGSYKWCRVSLAYQNYDIKVRSNGQNLDGTIASFVGFNTYLTKYKMKNTVVTPGTAGNKLQGYWGFYTKVGGVEYKSEGQSAGTTVVNPNFANSPIPAGSCLVTGEFFKTSTAQNTPLVITGNETSDIVITISLSTNKSFEWKELTADGLFEPGIGENVVDMGLRGMIPKY